MLNTKGNFASCLPPASISPDIVRLFTRAMPPGRRGPRCSCRRSGLRQHGRRRDLFARGAFAVGAALFAGTSFAGGAALAARATSAAMATARPHRIEMLRFMIA